MDYQTYRPMTKPLKTRKTFTRSVFAEHNYNYVTLSKTTHPPRRNTRNHFFSQKSNFSNTSTNSLNFHDHPHPSQDHSKNYPFFQQNKKNNKHPIIQAIYHPMMTIIINQIFFQHIHKNIVHKNLDKLKHLKM